MESQTSDKHKFQEDSEMTFEQVFDFAFRGYIAAMQDLAKKLGRDDFLEALASAASQANVQDVLNAARGVPRRDLALFTRGIRNPDRFWKHCLTFDIVQDTETTFEIKVTECLWAKTFRERNAADIGYATACHPDYAMCQAFNPRIRMTRTKTLMQGDDCCNLRWVWEK